MRVRFLPAVRVFSFTLAAALFVWHGIDPPDAAGQARGDPPDSTEVVVLEPIEVWHIREKSQARRAETMHLFTVDDLRRDDEISPYEFFKRVPGVNLVQGHALGYGLRNPVAGRVQIRGIGRKAGVDMRVRGVLLLMDGVPDFSVTHGHPLPDMFSRSYVDEIEVIKGPSSVRHGWAQAGAILMRSRDPVRLGSSGYAALSLGSFSTTQNLLDYNYRWQDGFVQLSGAWRQSDGHRPNSETKAIDGRARFAQKLAPNVSFVGSVRGGTNEWQIPGPVGGNPGVGGVNDWFIADAGLRVQAGKWDISGKAWGFDAAVDFDDGLQEPNEAIGGRLKADVEAWTGGSLTLGTDVMAYRVGRGTETVNRIDAPLEVAPYVWASHEVGQWLLSGGLRATFNDQFGEDLSPEVGVVFNPVSETALRAHVSHGFRAPNPFEFAFGRSQNPDLAATDLWQYELGLNQAFGAGGRLDLVVWAQEGSNMIQPGFDPAVQDVRLTNTGAFSHSGVEASVEWLTPSGVHFGAATAAMNVGAETALVPQNTVDFWVGWTGDAFRLTVDGRWADELYQRDNSELQLPNYLVANATAQYRLDNGLGLRFQVENLFDEEYVLFNNWPMPGIAFYGGIDWVF